MPALSYSHGVSDVPLLGETIGANLERTVARVRRPRGGRVLPPGRAADATPSSTRRSTGSRPGCSRPGFEKGDRVGIWSPNCAEWVLVQFATAKAGAILVNINPAYRTHEVEYALRQSGVKLLVSAPAFKTSDYRAMIDEVRGGLPALQARRLPRQPGVGRSSPATPVDADALRERHGRRSPSTTRSTSSTRAGRRASPRARRSRTTTSSTTATSSPSCATTPRPTASACRCPSTTASAWSWATSGAVTHGACIVIPAPAFDPGRRSRAVAARALHVALRRADDVHRRARPPGLRHVRPDLAAHRDHGRLAVPGRGDEARAVATCT